jgi:hypothetical protein
MEEVKEPRVKGNPKPKRPMTPLEALLNKIYGRT